MPNDDRFEVISEYPAADLIIDGSYLGIKRSNVRDHADQAEPGLEGVLNGNS